MSCRKQTPKQAVAAAAKQKGAALTAVERRVVMASAKLNPVLICKRGRR
jgi:hypothetical protein